MSRFHRILCQALVLGSLLTLPLSCDRVTTPDQETERSDLHGDVMAYDSLQHVRLLPYWITTAQFAGYYLGKELGIFKKHGIDLEIIQFLPTMQTDQIIRDQGADFFLLWLVNAIDLKDSGLDLVNIAQPSSRSSLMLLTKKKSGIESIAGMDGKRAAIWSGYEMQPQALFQKNHIQVEIIPIGSSNNLFLTDGVDIINANWFDEYHTILNSGYNEDELETFFYFDHGLNFLEDGIYCLQSTLEKDPDVCRRFVEATMESWKYAFEHPEEAVNVVLVKQRSEKMPANLAHQRWMLARYRDLYYPDPAAGINTTLKESDYRNIARILLEAGLIDAIPSFEDFYQPVPVHQNNSR